MGRRFVDRVCLVTGGGRGIGRGVALALAAEGAAVGVLARTRAQCEAVAREIGDRGLALSADVTDADAVDRALATLSDRLGVPSVLVNAAGISPVRERAETHDVDSFRQIVAVNLVGSFVVCRATFANLREQRGCVVNVASVLGTVASPRLAGYGASKAGLVQLTRTLAREWAPSGVRVNVVCPAYVDTELTRPMLSVDHIRDELTAQTPLGRLGRMEEVVAPILFLASDDASYVTGAVLLVDGGMAA